MKIIVFILSLYLTALSAMPCSDGEDLPQGVDKEISHAEKSGHADLCSPFCACACCGIHLLNYTPSHLFEAKPQSAATLGKTSRYKSTFISNYQQSIWQPPQLS